MGKRLMTVTALTLMITGAALATGPDGAALYKASCAACHGADGSGQTAVGKSMKVRDLRLPEVQKQTDIDLMKVIAGGKGRMPGYGKKMTTEDIMALIAQIRTLQTR